MLLEYRELSIYANIYLHICNSFYPTIHSIGQYTKFTVNFFLFYVRLRISQPGLYRSA